MAHEQGRPIAIREFHEAGIGSNAVTGLCGRRILVRIARGFYASAGSGTHVPVPTAGRKDLDGKAFRSTDRAVWMSRIAGRPLPTSVFVEAGITGGILRYLVARGRLVKCGWREFAVPEFAEVRPFTMVGRAAEMAEVAGKPVRAREFRAAGIESWAIARAVASGILARLSRGKYGIPTAEPEHSNRHNLPSPI